MKHNRRKRSIKRWLFSIAILLLVWDLGRFSVKLFDSAFVESDLPAQVDLIAVLTGGQGRLKEAMSLWLEGRGRYLFISGIEPGTTLEEIIRANKIEGPKLDEFRSKVLLDDESRSTLENAIELRQIVERLQAKSILLVTSTYHMYRAMNLIKRELERKPEITLKIYTSSVHTKNFNENNWFKSVVAWRILLTEYCKYRFSGFQLMFEA